MQKIHVTGAHGQLGRLVVARATELGYGDRVVAWGSDGLDITDAAAVDLVVDAGSIVVNCAAYTAVDAAETDEDRALAVNARGPENLARAAGRVGAHLIHVSTDYVFDGTASTPYAVDAPTGPRTAYGRTKLAGELAVHAALPTATVVRTAWVYTGVGSDFVATMRRLEQQRDTVSVVDDQVGSPTYAGDLAAGLLELVERLSSGSAPVPPMLHLTGAGSASWFDLARAVFAGVGADPERVLPCSSAEFVRPAHRPAYSVLSPQAWTDAGLTPARGWESALTEALNRTT